MCSSRYVLQLHPCHVQHLWRNAMDSAPGYSSAADLHIAWCAAYCTRSFSCRFVWSGKTSTPVPKPFHVGMTHVCCALDKTYHETTMRPCGNWKECGEDPWGCIRKLTLLLQGAMSSERASAPAFPARAYRVSALWTLCFMGLGLAALMSTGQAPLWMSVS